MNKPLIVCVEDEREVLDALVRDLKPFAEAFRIEATQTADEALHVIERAEAVGDPIALVLADHIMPGKTGVDLLVELTHRPGTVSTRKVLVTAQAGQQDTIRAVNEAHLDHYIAKPWAREQLQAVVRSQLTDYVIARSLNLLPFLKTLNSPRLMEAIRTRGAAVD